MTQKIRPCTDVTVKPLLVDELMRRGEVLFEERSGCVFRSKTASIPAGKTTTIPMGKPPVQNESVVAG